MCFATWKTTKFSRDEAKEPRLQGKIVRVFQAHNLDVMLEGRDGKNIWTQEPRIDAIFEVIEACGSLWENIPWYRNKQYSWECQYKARFWITCIQSANLYNDSEFIFF